MIYSFHSYSKTLKAKHGYREKFLELSFGGPKGMRCYQFGSVEDFVVLGMV